MFSFATRRRFYFLFLISPGGTKGASNLTSLPLPPLYLNTLKRSLDFFFAFGQEHFGALLVGRRGQAECPHELVLANSSFTTCVVSPTAGAGGSLAIFDTSATITECTFEKGQGTAVLFESSSPNGSHTISVSEAFYHYCCSAWRLEKTLPCMYICRI